MRCTAAAIETSAAIGGGAAAALADRLDDGGRLFAALAIIDRDRGARLGQRQGDRLADAARGRR